ncbi:MAG: hypothetical protein ACAI35_26290 [Candidatus Methylacidiphilales bacterium]|nr:hypothetical protein [Candidatus Methylacidiphilales bacterium]
MVNARVEVIVTATFQSGKINPFWSLKAMSTEPRHWTRDEVSLSEEGAD